MVHHLYLGPCKSVVTKRRCPPKVIASLPITSSLFPPRALSGLLHLPLPPDPEIPLEGLDDRVVNLVAVPDLDVPHKVDLLVIDVLADLTLEGPLRREGLLLVRLDVVQIRVGLGLGLGRRPRLCAPRAGLGLGGRPEF